MTVRNSHRSCCTRKLFLKVLQYPQETPVLESISKKVAELQTCNFIKKGSKHSCFPVSIAKFLILPILKNICKRLLFSFFSDCMTESGFRVLAAGLVFVFKSTPLVLKQVPTCIGKPKTNTFDKSSFYSGYFWSFQMVLGRFRLFQAVLDCFRLFQVVLDRSSLQ